MYYGVNVIIRASLSLCGGKLHYKVTFLSVAAWQSISEAQISRGGAENLHISMESF